MAYVVWSFLAESVLNRRLRCRGTCFAHGRGYRLVADVAKLMRVRGRAQRGLHQRMEAAAAVCESVVDFRTATFVRECVCMRCTLVFLFSSALSGLAAVYFVACDFAVFLLFLLSAHYFRGCGLILAVTVDR